MARVIHGKPTYQAGHGAAGQKPKRIGEQKAVEEEIASSLVAKMSVVA